MTSNMLSSLRPSKPAGPDSDPLRNGFQATSLDSDEVVRLLDACIRHQDHFDGIQGQVMLLLLVVAQQVLT